MAKINEEGEQRVIVVGFNHIIGKHYFPAWILGKNKTLGALISFGSGNKMWMSKEHLETICTDIIQWRKIKNLQ